MAETLWKLKKIVTFSLDFKDLFVLIFSTFAMFLTVYTFINCDYFSLIINIGLSVILGVIVYLVFCIPFLTKAKFFEKKANI